MDPAYRIYGFRVSADLPIPGLPTACDPQPGDIRIRLNRMPPWWDGRPQAADTVWYSGPHLTVWKLEQPGWYRLLYRDHTEFVIDPHAGEVWSRWPSTATLEDSATYLRGPVMGFILRLRKICCLHASGVVVDRKILAFAGPPGAGKSTTAAAFANLGYPVLSDDIVAMQHRDGEFWALPGYPHLCLWPDSAAALGSPDLPRITPAGGSSDWWDKSYLDLLARGQFQMQPMPLGAVYLLQARSAASDCPKTHALSAAAATSALAFNTYMKYLLDRSLRTEEFHFLNTLYSKVPVRGVVPHADPSALNRLCETIVEDYRRLPALSPNAV